MATSDAAVTALCDSVMVGVVRTCGDRLRGREDEACAVMRDEIRAAVLGEGDYAGAREAVAYGGVGPGWYVGLIVANCAARLCVR